MAAGALLKNEAECIITLCIYLSERRSTRSWLHIMDCLQIHRSPGLYTLNLSDIIYSLVPSLINVCPYVFVWVTHSKNSDKNSYLQ